MYLIVGLGNPGRQYFNTRHNAGFEVIDYLCDKNNLKLNQTKFNAIYEKYMISNQKVILMKPLTYMNNSGISVSEFVRYFDIEIDKTIIIYDDIDLELGQLRIRKSGGAGTHNGLKSVLKHLGTDNFTRIRLGVGNNGSMDLASYVLSKFAENEKVIIDEIIKKAGDAAETVIIDGIDKAMNNYNIK